MNQALKWVWHMFYTPVVMSVPSRGANGTCLSLQGMLNTDT